MLRSGKIAGYILLLSLLQLQCTQNKNIVKLSDRNFSDEIQLQQNLVFTFDKDVQPDSLLNVWDSVEYVKFTPQVKGLFKWNSPRELIFSPFNQFVPSTKYKAELTKNILKKANHNYTLSGDKPMEFHTPFLKMEGVDAFWVRSSTSPNAVALKMNVRFNYKVEPGELARLTKLSINNQPVLFDVQSSAVTDIVTLIANSLPANVSDKTQLNITVARGLRCMDSEWITPDTLLLSQSVASPEKLAITYMEGSYENNMPYISVSANQAVSMDGINDLIKITPAVKFTTEAAESGFIIRGDFKNEITYTVTVSKNLKGLLGVTMANDHVATVPFGQLEPSISFANTKGIYLSSKSAKKLAINIVNVPKVKVTITKIYENNIISYLKNNRYNEYYGEEDGYDYSYNDYNLEYLGDLVYEKTIDTKDLAKSNGINLLSVDLEQQNNFRGIYLIKAASQDDQWRRSMKLISVSDIGLIAKQTDEEIFVFANSIMDATPVGGVKINFTSSNNQVLYTATTNADGVAKFSNIKAKYPEFKVAMITARNGDDFNYMLFNDARVETSRFDVGGKRRNDSGYECFIYGDREIYRPGEKIYFNTIVRNNLMETVSNVPVKIKILLPNGKEFYNARTTLNTQGAVESQVDLPVSTVTGTYTVEVFTSNDVLIGSKNISVEEFIPDRINVKLNIDKTQYELTDSVQVSIEALNLFGPPAANRNYETEFSLNRKNFFVKKFSDYNFSISGADKTTMPQQLRQGKTDANGKAVERFVIDPAYKDMGILSGKIFTTVFDESGRPVNRIKNFEIITQKVFYGIKLPDYYFDTRKQMQIGLIGVDPAGNALKSASAKLQVIRVRWHHVMERNYNNYRYVSQKEEEPIMEKIVALDAGGTIVNFTPNESGEYIIRVKNPLSNSYIEENFYAYGWGNTQNSSFEVNNEGTIDISTDKEKYSPGEKANILFKTPFSGKLLITVERDKVFEYYLMKTDKKAAMLSLPIKNEYLPNMYISATLFKPLDDVTIPLTVAHGFASVAVEKPENKLPVTITAVEKSFSKTKLTVKVKTIPKPDVEVTIAVVDEGIMQLKDTKTPDPYGYFYQKRALEVNSMDVYPYLLPNYKMGKSSTAGDGYDLQKRVNPLSNKRVKLIAYWSGILKTNSSGEGVYSFDIPQFSGDLRVMAVAYKDKSFGNAEKHIKVADPVVLSASIPRFFSPGDSLLMPVTFSNTTSVPVAASAIIRTSGPLVVMNNTAQAFSIPANSETRVDFKVAALQDIGEGSIEVVATADGKQYTDKTDITIRPPASLQKISGNGMIEGNSTKVISLKNNFIPASAESKLVISRSPMVQFADQLQYLLDYPYGCVEQTTSIAFPQLYYADLISTLKNKPGGVVNISRNIQAAISRLQSMQTYNGSLSYWPGGDYESWWGTVYACHFLQEAKKAGYAVNQDFLDRIYAYLLRKLKNHETENYWYCATENCNPYLKSVIPAKDNFYSMYVLALAGKADLPTMNYYKSHIKELAVDSKYLLAVTYMICGDRKSYSELLPTSFDEFSRKSTGGNFYSYIRDEGLALNGMLEGDPNNPQVAVMVRHLSKQIRSERYLNTQERAFAFLALGKFMKRSTASDITAGISVNGNTAPFTGKDVILTKEISGKDVSIKTSGTGTLYYFWETEGLTKDGSYKNEDNFLKIRKSFYNRFGQPVTGNNFKQNDLVVIKLSLENTEHSFVENIVITDILPAGFEIENPRVGSVPDLNWIKDNSMADYMDIRDDRINLFTSVDYQPRNFYYVVRAVSTGKFIMGPVGADAMYNGEYHSYNGAGVVNVKP